MSSSLVIFHPSGHTQEREYTFIIFKEFLGLDYECCETPGDVVQIRLADAPESGALNWRDVLFQKRLDEWLAFASLPRMPLPEWNAAHDLPEAKLMKPVIPVIYGAPIEDGTWFILEGNSIRLGLDIAGSVFFMLSRYEEAVRPERDEHDRFPATASLAYRADFLDRPIVDEYIEVLWACLKRLWPGLQRKQPCYQVCLSHDVDEPLGAVNKPWPRLLRSLAGDVAQRKDLGLAYRRFKARLSGNHDMDPFNTFDFVMDTSERYGLKSAFYFKTGATNSRFDAEYALHWRWIQALLRRIYERGHEIGLHTSYDAYNNLERTRAEFEALLKVAERLKIVQHEWGGRQHYLRWENPTTWQIWEEVGLDYDATLGFPDHVGFRCGTCHEFPVFNLKTRKTLRLRERPLIVMDGTLTHPQYMGLRPAQVLEWIQRLSDACRQYNGVLNLLWHNSSLIQSWEKELYSELFGVIT